MVKLNLIFLVFTIPSVISSTAPHCQTLQNSTTTWSCRYSRNFPTDLYNTSTVEKLYLNRNEVDLPPLEKLTSKDIQLYKLPNLAEFELRYYIFYEVEPGAFKNEGKLVNLTLHWNGMKKLDPQVFLDVPNLQKLQIKYQPFTTDDFENSEFPELENLTELVLQDLRIPSLKPNLLKNLKSLQILDLRGNKLTILDNREVFRPLKNLKKLKFSSNRISYVDPEIFADLEKLEALDLSSNNLHKGFKNNTKFHNPNLIKLDLINCQLKYIEADLFQYLGNLKELFLSRNHLSYIPQKLFASLKNLETLSLNGNSIKTVEPGIFSGLGNLKSLDLTGNQLKTLDWKVLRNLKTLSTIDLGGNPWQCDCQVLYLQRFLKRRNINLKENYPNSPTCKTYSVKGEPIQHGGFMKWKDIKPEKLSCLAFPNITKLSADKDLKLGESVNLQCDFSGALPLQIIWMKGGVVLRNFTLSEDEPLHYNKTLMEYNDQLTIQNFKEDDAGLYKVVVSNEAGEIEKSEYFDLSKESSTLDSKDIAEQNFLHFLQSLFEIMF